MEAFNFFLERYHIEPLLLDILIILLSFGILSTLIFSYMKGRWNKKAVFYQILVIIMAFVSVGYFVVNPLKLNPRSIRFVSLTGSLSPLANFNSVAVLPIQNNLPNKEKDYLLAGLHDGIITELGKLGTIKTIGQTSTLQYAETTKSLKQIGKELDVKSILESSISVSGDGYIFRSRLIDSVTEEILWNDEYSTTIDEFPTLLDVISEIVAIKLDPESTENVRVQQQTNSKAYEEVLKGNYLLQKFSKEGLEESLIHFKKAIEIDSNYIEGYLGVAKSWLYMQQIAIVDPKIARPQIIKYSERAMSIDSTSWNSYILRGGIAFYIDYDYEKGIEMLQKSLEINPNNSDVRSGIAHLYMLVGDWDNAWKQIEYAKEIDPLNPQVIGFEMGLLAGSGKLLSAFKQSKLLAIIGPETIFNKINMVVLSRAFGEDEKAIEGMKNLYFEGTSNPKALNAFIDNEYSRTGDVNQTWLATLKYLETADYQKYLPPDAARVLYSFIPGYDDDLFFKYLEQMAKDRHPEIPYYALKDGSPLQDDPRYIKIMEDLGLW